MFSADVSPAADAVVFDRETRDPSGGRLPVPPGQQSLWGHGMHLHRSDTVPAQNRVGGDRARGGRRC
jgi:hypothetical protein